MLNWDEYVKQGVIRKTILNKGKIKALLQIANSRLKMISYIEINEENASVVFTNYYDSLREICEALALLNGYKIYLQEPIGLFLRDILKKNIFFMKFDRFRQLRNGINYYGRTIPLKEAKETIKDIKEMINKLKLEYLREFCN